MKTMITFRHMIATPAIKTYATEKLSRLERYVKNTSEAHLILTAEKKFHSAEVVFSAKGVRAQGKVESKDMYASIDAAVEKVEKTLQRFHAKKISEAHHPEPVIEPATVSTRD